MAMQESKVRRGASWREEYRSKLCTAEEAAALIKDNDVIAMQGGTGIPDAFSRALAARAHELHNVRLLQGLALTLYDYMRPEYRDNICVETVFLGPAERLCLQWGTAIYVPIHLNELGAFIDDRKPNVITAVVTPPDEDGYMNRSCFGGLCVRRAFERADTVIVEVNEGTPWLAGEDFKIHVSEVDYIIENNGPLVEIPDIPITETEQQLAYNIAEMIPDGATIQLGFGGLANAIGYFLRDKKDLGMHTEVVSTSVMELMKLGVVNNSRKNFWPGKVVATFCVGNKELWEFINHNENFVFCEVEYTNNPSIIAQNDGIISVNNALMMDLTGQAASESIGTMQYSATGGQVNFVRGAAMSRGGKSIIALNSTFKDKEGNLRSRIMPMFPPGTAVTTSRNDVEYVATEYGVAHLRYKNVRERARAMISIAHPDFREELTHQARTLGWL